MGLIFNSLDISRIEGIWSPGFNTPPAMASLIWSVTCLYIGSGFKGLTTMNNVSSFRLLCISCIHSILYIHIRVKPKKGFFYFFLKTDSTPIKKVF